MYIPFSRSVDEESKIMMTKMSRGTSEGPFDGGNSCI